MIVVFKNTMLNLKKKKNTQVRYIFSFATISYFSIVVSFTTLVKLQLHVLTALEPEPTLESNTFFSFQIQAQVK